MTSLSKLPVVPVRKVGQLAVKKESRLSTTADRKIAVGYNVKAIFPHVRENFPQSDQIGESSSLLLYNASTAAVCKQKVSLRQPHSAVWTCTAPSLGLGYCIPFLQGDVVFPRIWGMLCPPHDGDIASYFRMGLVSAWHGRDPLGRLQRQHEQCHMHFTSQCGSFRSCAFNVSPEFTILVVF